MVVAVWFHPGTRKLHIRDGMDGNGNAGCDPILPGGSEELPQGQETRIAIAIGANGVDVSLNDVVVCSRQASLRRPWQNVHVFAGDPWHDPADAKISRLVISPQDPPREMFPEK